MSRILQIFWLEIGVDAGHFGVPRFTVFLVVVDIATLAGMQAKAATDCDGCRISVVGLKNTGGCYCGIGACATVIEHFTEGYPWAHLDMASMSLTEDAKPAQPKGATGYGVRLFTAYLEKFQVEG